MKTSFQSEKTSSIFFCRTCGYKSFKWLGKCPECDEWNSLVEDMDPAEITGKRNAGSKRLTAFVSSGPALLKDINVTEAYKIPAGIGEFDRILGGGVVPGSLILLGGPPGIGKSTLMLQIAGRLQVQTGGCVLYVSGEESLAQIKNRAQRLNVSADKLYLLSETKLENIIAAVNNIHPGIVIIDSIQTTYKDTIEGGAGSVAQIRECTVELVSLAKSNNIAIFVLGHVTKEGELAGPKLLEHMVDTVLYFESEATHAYRILRVFKNRFGPVQEIGVFHMCHDGLREVSNPSMIFLPENRQKTAGAACVCALEGTRPLLLEIQALVSRAPYNMPRRSVNGGDVNRVIMLLAVLEKRAKLPLANCDVFVNVGGGARVKEAAGDLGVAIAIASASVNFDVDAGMVFIGEVSLDGSVRTVPCLTERLSEARRLGFRQAMVPKAGLPAANVLKLGSGFELLPVTSLSECIKILK